MVRLAQCLLCLCLLVPAVAAAMRLGEIEVKSFLNQPLRAQIVVSDTQGLSEKELLVQLASERAFAQLEMDKLAFLDDLHFAVRREKQQLVIDVSSKQAVGQPVADFLLDIRWPNGRLLRRYTVLLDVPRVAAEGLMKASTDKQVALAEQVTTTDSTAAVASVNNVVRASSADSNTVKATAAPSVAASTPVASAASVSKTPKSYGPTNVKDKLIYIARRLRPSAEVSIAQTAVAIYRTNPHAFYRNSMANLKRDQILVAPSLEAIQQIDPQDADLLVWHRAGATAIQAASHPGVVIAKANDNLLLIAERVRPNRTITTEQMAWALFRKNRQGFAEDNVNGLHLDQVLRIPTLTEVKKTSAQKAQQMIEQHHRAWRKQHPELYNTETLRGVKSVPTIAGDSPAIEAHAAAPQPAAVNEAHAAAPQPAAVNEAHTAAPQPAAVNEAHTAAPQPAAVNEAHATAPQPAAVINAHTAAPQPAAVINAHAAAPQSAAVNEAHTAAPQPASAPHATAAQLIMATEPHATVTPPMTKTSQLATTHTSSAPAATSGVPASVVSSSVNSLSKTASPVVPPLHADKSVEQMPAVQAQQARTAPTQSNDAHVAQAKPMLTTASSVGAKPMIASAAVSTHHDKATLWYVVAATVLLLVAISGGLFWWRQRGLDVQVGWHSKGKPTRRKQRVTTVLEPAIVQGPVGAWQETVTEHQPATLNTAGMLSTEESTAAPLVSAKDSLRDTTQPIVAEAVTTSENAAKATGYDRDVDPAEEALVYIAYQRYAQAEHCLLSGLAQQPERDDLKVCLLEVYAIMQDKDNFASWEAMLDPALQTTHPSLWDKVNTYKQRFFAEVAAFPDALLATDVAPSGTVAPVQEDSAEAAFVTEIGSEGASVSDVLVTETTTDAVVVQSEQSPLAFELDTPRVAAFSAAQEPVSAPLQQEEAMHFEYGLGTEFQFAKKQEPSLFAEVVSTDDTGFDESSMDPAAQLELAAAYLEIDDPEGARGLLNGVLRRGDQQQQAEAHALLARINTNNASGT